MLQLIKKQLIFTGRRISGETSANVTSSINLDLITSDQYSQAYLDYFFSDKGPITKLENYFMEANDRQRKPKMPLGCKIKREAGKQGYISDEENTEEKRPSGNMERGNQKDENLKLSIVETQPHEWKPRMGNVFMKARRFQIFTDMH